MPTMTLRWPNEAAPDPGSLARSLVEAAGGRFGAAVTIALIRDLSAFPVTLQWQAVFFARTEDELTSITEKVAAGSTRVLA